jgi:heptaprenyl diphosphate synthase
VNVSRPAVRKASSLSSALGLGEKLFASAGDRRFASAVEDGLDAVEAGLLEEMSFADSLADTTSRYLLAAGGKRIRPTLALLTAQLGNGNAPAVIAAAEAIEMTHLASLYHDDVMDEAQMRRGVPSAQSVWGNSVAILTGDLLFARASKLVAGLGEPTIRLQAETFERLCLGQLHETMGPRDDEDPIDHYLSVLADKTGSLISAASWASCSPRRLRSTGFRSPSSARRSAWPSSSSTTSSTSPLRLTRPERRRAPTSDPASPRCRCSTSAGWPQPMWMPLSCSRASSAT